MKHAVAFLVAFILAFSLPFVCYADTSEVLPKGIFYFDTTYYHYFDITERYNPDGDTEDIDIDYNTSLDSTVFPALAPLDPLVGGNASIGRSVVDFTWKYDWFEFKLAYGITDKLSVGVLIPYNHTKNEVKANIDTSTANVGKNPLYGTPEDPFKSPIIPLAMGGVPFNKEDTIDLLGNGLDVNKDGVVDVPGFGYKRFGSWSDTMLGDIEVGAKYQFYNKGNWALSGLVGLRLPTGEVDDPDDLVDIKPGDGQADILLRLFADYTGIKNLLLATTLYYDIQLPDKQKLRVLDDVNFPLTVNKETVDRDLGDAFELRILGNYSLSKAVSAGLEYRFTTKATDSIDGDKGYCYSCMEEETDYTSHMILASLGYSTMQMYMDKKFKVPLNASITYRNRFAGTNNVTKSQYISLDLGVYF
jgi:hypothetical protein